MRLDEFDPNIDGSSLEDCEVVGLDGDFVLHFNADDGTVYNGGVTLQEWLDGHGEAWLMTRDEAERVGIADYDSYKGRLAELNPALFEKVSALSGSSLGIL